MYLLTYHIPTYHKVKENRNRHRLMEFSGVSLVQDTSARLRQLPFPDFPGFSSSEGWAMSMPFSFRTSLGSFLLTWPLIFQMLPYIILLQFWVIAFLFPASDFTSKLLSFGIRFSFPYPFHLRFSPWYSCMGYSIFSTRTSVNFCGNWRGVRLYYFHVKVYIHTLMNTNAFPRIRVKTNQNIISAQ